MGHTEWVLPPIGRLWLEFTVRRKRQKVARKREALFLHVKLNSSENPKRLHHFSLRSLPQNTKHYTAHHSRRSDAHQSYAYKVDQLAIDACFWLNVPLCVLRELFPFPRYILYLTLANHSVA